MRISRREFIRIGTRVAAVAAAGRFLVTDALAATAGAGDPYFAQLDRFVEQYLRDMNAPAMTLVLADRNGILRVANYGFGDLERHVPVAEDALFQIGSISKSFVALCLMQLRDEGKFDVHQPIAQCMPWLRVESSFAPITVHHLLTHTSGLPDGGSLFLSDPKTGHRAANEPGRHFHYCNMAFEALGHLLWTLDGRPLAEVLRKRVFEPLSMARSEPHISFDIADRLVRSYWDPLVDRPTPRDGRLGEAPGIISSNGAGCIAATAHDMGQYIRMLANGGKGPHGPLLSDQGFALFSTPYIKADEFGPTASYGYGIVVDRIDGHRIVRHTGGMVSFASSIQVDLDEGVGAFASINAMQGFRPTPVTDFAVRLMRANRQRKPLPPVPPRNDPNRIENAADFAGVFRDTDGRRLEFVAEGERLFQLHAGRRIAIEGDGDVLIAPDQDFARFPLLFGRADPKNPKSAVVDVSWGGDWYVNDRYTGPTAFVLPAQWQAYVGHYHSDDPWVGSMRILVRKGRLTVDGAVPLEPGEDSVFHLRDEEHNPEWIAFLDIVNGKAMRLQFSGADLWRVMVA